jgi:hypothetical protein
VSHAPSADYTLTAEAGLAAAAQGRFRPMSDRIYAVGGRVDRAGVELIARELGLDMIRFRADLDTHVHRPQIESDVKDAVALGVTGTPTFFVNGRPVHGNMPLKMLPMSSTELAAARVGGPRADARADQRRGEARAPPAVDRLKQTYKMGPAAGASGRAGQRARHDRGVG